MKKIIFFIVTAILGGFALLTLFLSTSVIFDWFNIREKEGNYVLFIVWANFLSSLIYLLSVYGLINRKYWTYKILGFSAVLLILAFTWLLIHIESGGIYEKKTIGAMIFRIILTIGFTLFAYFSINRKKLDLNLM